MIWDLTIIGGGPVGSFAGYLAEKNNIKTLILEEHSQIGEPVHCLGKLSIHAFEEFPLPKTPILNSLKGGYFFSPEGEVIKLKKNNIDSYILDRTLFDRLIAEMAEKEGCVFNFNSKAIGVEQEKGYSSIIVKENEKIRNIDTRVIIDAEGAKRQFLRKIGMPGKTHLVSLQYEISGVEVPDKECVELYFGKKYSIGFFLWIAPYGAKIKLGVAVEPPNNPKIFLDKFIEKNLKERASDIKIERSYGGIIPIFGPYEEYIYPNIIVIGDAAGYNKSTTGGGIYFGLQGASLAITQVKKYLDSGDLKYLKDYPKQTNKKFGKELKFTKMGRKLLNELSDNDLNFVWRVIKENPSIMKAVEESGDTAYQTSLLRVIPTLISPKSIKLIKLLPKILKAL